MAGAPPKLGCAGAAEFTGNWFMFRWGTGLKALFQISPPSCIDFCDVRSKLVPVSPVV